jgi:hypothetical protein
VMYDRVNSLGHWPERPLMPGGPSGPRPHHVRGGQIIRSEGSS